MEGKSHPSPEAKIELNAVSESERIFVASQWQLMWWKFRRHKAAMGSAVLLVVLYTIVILAEFFSPYLPSTRSEHLFAPPQGIHFRESNGRLRLRPFVYGIKKSRDLETLQWIYEPDQEKIYFIRFLVKGEPYKLWGRLETDVHFFGINHESWLFLFGSDHLGRDILSRILHAGRVSLSLVLLTVSINLSLGLLLGGISGLYGGVVDNAIQRLIEVLQGVPKLPLWMGLAAAIPSGWTPVKQYLAMSLVLSLIGWTGAARIVRSKFLSTREQDFVLAARLYGTSDGRLILLHLIPSFMSYVIVRATLDLPGAILGETSLSFLGVGLRPPALSLGVLLKQAQNIRTVAFYPWLMFPALVLVVAILAYNFLGDGLRDAADPYAR